MAPGVGGAPATGRAAPGTGGAHAPAVQRPNDEEGELGHRGDAGGTVSGESGRDGRRLDTETLHLICVENIV